MQKQYIRISEYQLRKAAGKYWLLYMEQDGVPYIPPFPINAVAAEIWRELQAGKSQGEIVDALSLQYDISREEMKEDMQAFIRQLEVQGIKVEE